MPRGREREAVVGAACLRLRKQGCKVEVSAYGARIAEPSRREIVRGADALVALLGGLATAEQVLRLLRDAKFYHDGMWLFGEVGFNLYDAKRPMIPVGWLFSLALRHLGRPGGGRKPEVAWKFLVDLATDFDCRARLPALQSVRGPRSPRKPVPSHAGQLDALARSSLRCRRCRRRRCA